MAIPAAASSSSRTSITVPVDSSVPRTSYWPVSPLNTCPSPHNTHTPPGWTFSRRTARPADLHWASIDWRLVRAAHRRQRRYRARRPRPRPGLSQLSAGRRAEGGGKMKRDRSWKLERRGAEWGFRDSSAVALFLGRGGGGGETMTGSGS